jgi:hypothetical protein
MTPQPRPEWFFIVAGLFGLAAVRDAFFPHFFSLGQGHAVTYAAIAFLFVVLGFMKRDGARPT